MREEAAFDSLLSARRRRPVAVVEASSLVLLIAAINRDLSDAVVDLVDAASSSNGSKDKLRTVSATAPKVASSRSGLLAPLPLPPLSVDLDAEASRLFKATPVKFSSSPRVAVLTETTATAVVKFVPELTFDATTAVPTNRNPLFKVGCMKK